MAKISKRVAAFRAKVDRNKFYPIDDALNLVKEFATAKFDESIDVSVQLGIDHSWSELWKQLGLTDIRNTLRDWVGQP